MPLSGFPGEGCYFYLGLERLKIFSEQYIKIKHATEKTKNKINATRVLASERCCSISGRQIDIKAKKILSAVLAANTVTTTAANTRSDAKFTRPIVVVTSFFKRVKTLLNKAQKLRFSFFALILSLSPLNDGGNISCEQTQKADRKHK